MRVLLTVLLLAVGIASANIKELSQSDDLADLADLGESYGREEKMVGDTLMASQDRSTDEDLLIAECYQNSLEDAKPHCESKTSEEQCSGAMRDWYCDAGLDHTCEADKPMECRAVVTNGPDTFMEAKCCNWDDSRDPKCTIDKSDGVGNKCNQTETSLDKKKLFE